MDLRFVELDALLDRASAGFVESDASSRERWSFLQLSAWLFHELQLEGVSLLRSDMERAFAGEEGVDYCDRVRLDQVRLARALLASVREHGEDETALDFDLLSEWQRTIAGAETAALRLSDGATEHYKHDVVLASEARAAAEAALERAEGARADEHPLAVATRLLYALSRAWPYASWSGAVARWATSAVLIGRGYPPLVVPVSERSSFYQALHYDPSRLESLVIGVVRSQLEMKERFFAGELELGSLWGEAGPPAP